MSQINFSAHIEQENQLGQNLRNVKQIGAADIPRSTKKKTALSDVKNILAQRNLQSAKKPLASTTKTSFPQQNLLSNLDKENEVCKKEIKKEVKSQAIESSIVTSNSIVMNEADEEIVEPVCSFCGKHEDDLADMMLKSITLTKSEIHKLALEWERPPIVGLSDVRKFQIPETIPNELVSISDWPELDYEFAEPDISLLNDIPAVESIFDYDIYEE